MSLNNVNTALATFYEKTAWLYTEVWQTPLFFIDYWSLIHFGSGFVLMGLVRRFRLPYPWTTLFAVLFAYELLELAFLWFLVHIFRPESLSDQVTDLWVGGLGALLGSAIGKSSPLPICFLRSPVPSGRTNDLTIGCVLASIWVAGYGYRYNVSWLNSTWINWWALLLWSLGCYAMLSSYRRLRDRFSPWPALIGVWSTSIIAILIVEYVGYRILGIRELSDYPPLVFGLIHGTPALKCVYMTAAPITIFTAWIVDLFRNKRRTEAERA